MKYTPAGYLLSKDEDLRNDFNNFVRECQKKKHASYDLRITLPKKYLKGFGIEIGAFHAPLPIPPNCKVEYLDKVNNKTLINWMPDFANDYIVFPKYIDDGEEVKNIKSSSLDFVIANHMIEHCQNAFKTIENHMHLLNDNGHLFYALPDKRETFDKNRQLTTYEHLIDEYLNGHTKNAFGHFIEYGRMVNGIKSENELHEYANDCIIENRDIHFHVWTLESFKEQLSKWISEYNIPLKIEECEKNGIEFILILKKIKL